MIFSPSNQFIVYGIKARSSELTTQVQTKQPDPGTGGNNSIDVDLTIYNVIGTAMNIMIDTVRGKVPIFAMGNSEAIGIARGAQFISGSIDSVVIDLSVLNDMLATQKSYITEIEKKLLDGIIPEDDVIEVEKRIYGNTVKLYQVLENQLDSILLDELSVVQANPLPKDGNVYYSALKLIDVEFHSYSYAKRSTDVVQLERLEFIARTIYPFTLNMMDKDGNVIKI